MRHVRLESKRARSIHSLQQINHSLPAMHSAPADFALGCQTLAEPFSHITSLRKRLRNPLLIPFGVLRPIGHAARGINPDNAIRANTQITQRLSDMARLANLADKVLAVSFAAQRGTPAGWLPHVSDY